MRPFQPGPAVSIEHPSLTSAGERVIDGSDMVMSRDVLPTFARRSKPQLEMERMALGLWAAPLALTSPPPLLPLLTPSLTRSLPSLTHASPPTHPRWVRICWPVPALTLSSMVQILIRELTLNSTRPAMWADLYPWPTLAYIWALSLPALNPCSNAPLPPASPVLTATSCPFCLPPLDWPPAGSSFYPHLAPQSLPCKWVDRPP